MDKSRKSRTSLQTENEELQLKVLENLSPKCSNDINTEEEVTFVDNDIYERDSNAGEDTPFTAVNFNVEEDTYEIPENNRLSLPVIPIRTTSSLKPALPQRMSLPVWNVKEANNILDLNNNHKKPQINESDVKPELPPRKSTSSPQSMKIINDSLSIPIPIKSQSNEESSSESESESSNSESDFEDLPPPITQAPLPPDSAKQGACGGFDPNESEYLEPISHMDDHDSDTHDYDPVYIPSNPGESHMLHLIDETNYIKGKRNRSASKASLNPYEEIEFGDMDDSERENQELLTIDSEPPPPPKLTPRSSRYSGASPLPSPRLPPRINSVFNSPTSNNNTQNPSPSHNGEKQTLQQPPKLKPRSSVSRQSGANENCRNIHIVPPQLAESVSQQEPRYSGLIEVNDDSDIDGHEYTPLDHSVEGLTADNEKPEEDSKKELETSQESNHDMHSKQSEDTQIYEPIEDHNDNDGIYEPVEFH